MTRGITLKVTDSDYQKVRAIVYHDRHKSVGHYVRFLIARDLERRKDLDDPVNKFIRAHGQKPSDKEFTIEDYLARGE